MQCVFIIFSLQEEDASFEVVSSSLIVAGNGAIVQCGSIITDDLSILVHYTVSLQ